jgi:hypothetical protein
MRELLDKTHHKSEGRPLRIESFVPDSLLRLEHARNRPRKLGTDELRQDLDVVANAREVCDLAEEQELLDAVLPKAFASCTFHQN